MKRKNSGFSVVELITVITIVSILVSLLLPGISMVRTLAKNTQQKAQFATLELGIEAFKNDFGQYPESK
ncbi:MAG TPA: type II secretion system protein, partial [Sedimentisphaerales bacterium]|nr:type II secretion system protein [Sedimentisphaerales bacterium]